MVSTSEPKILWQSGDFALVDKPSGWLSVPSRFEEKDARPVAGRWLEKKTSTRVFPVHRLDLEVSGLILFALSSPGQRQAQEWFEKRWLSKTYEAWSRARDFSHWPSNVPAARDEMLLEDGSRWEWSCKIERGKRRSFVSERGDPALTRVEFRGEVEGVLRWNLQPVTGRSHQLRLEMSRRGFPLLGDDLYGSKEKFRDGAVALRSFRLDLSGVPPEKRKGLPEDFTIQGL